ncbi:MAG TPA: hypothetical protein VK506_07720 [Conexibacter sp.]|nr:hypothetical protein [Conexibacter sp.]
MFELANDALAEQERQVSEMRTRSTAVVGIGGVIGGLLGQQVFAGSHPAGAVEWAAASVGLIAAAALLAFAMRIVGLHRLGFSLDAEASYAWLYEHGVVSQPYVDLELTERLSETREDQRIIRRLERSFVGALVHSSS